eukprot:COSAG04_NODE_4212_length_2228_cov_15.077971_1_plen_690_part_01
MQDRNRAAPLDPASRKARGKHSPVAARAAPGDDRPGLEPTNVLHVLTTAIVNKALLMFQRPTAAQLYGSGRARFRSRRLPWVWVKVLFTLDFENPCAVALCGADWCYRWGECGTGNAGAPDPMPEPKTDANGGKLVSAGGTKVRREDEPPPKEPTGGWLEGSEALHLLFAEVLELGAGATADAIKTALDPIVQDQNEFVAGTTVADFVAVVKELVDLGEKGAHHGQWQVAWGQGGRPANGECRNLKAQFGAAGVMDPMDWGRTLHSTDGCYNLGAETQGGGFCLVTHEQVQMTKAMERFMGSQCVNDLDKLRQEERGAEADVGDTKAVLQELEKLMAEPPPMEEDPPVEPEPVEPPIEGERWYAARSTGLEMYSRITDDGAGLIIHVGALPFCVMSWDPSHIFWKWTGYFPWISTPHSPSMLHNLEPGDTVVGVCRPLHWWKVSADACIAAAPTEQHGNLEAQEEFDSDDDDADDGAATSTVGASASSLLLDALQTACEQGLDLSTGTLRVLQTAVAVAPALAVLDLGLSQVGELLAQHQDLMRRSVERFEETGSKVRHIAAARAQAAETEDHSEFMSESIQFVLENPQLLSTQLENIEAAIPKAEAIAKAKAQAAKTEDCSEFMSESILCVLETPKLLSTPVENIEAAIPKAEAIAKARAQAAETEDHSEFMSESIQFVRENPQLLSTQ